MIRMNAGSFLWLYASNSLFIIRAIQKKDSKFANNVDLGLSALLSLQVISSCTTIFPVTLFYVLFMY